MLTVPSGAAVDIKVAPFLDAMNLKNALAREVSVGELKLDFKNLSASDIDVGTLIKMALSVDSSAVVQAALWKCLERCTYNNEKITPGIFEPAERREDYYPIITECLTVNLRDFFKPLVSRFQSHIEKMKNAIPPSK